MYRSRLPHVTKETIQVLIGQPVTILILTVRHIMYERLISTGVLVWMY